MAESLIVIALASVLIAAVLNVSDRFSTASDENKYVNI
jgi:hypothetical protein